MILTSQAWHEGYAAGRRGLTAAENPYPLGSGPAVEWLSGLAAGRTKPRLMVVDGGRCT